MNLAQLFQGRLNRQNYAVIFLLNVIGVTVFFNLRTTGLPKEWATLIPEMIVFIVVDIITWSGTIRRLHDCKYSGWFVLLSLVPIVSAILPLFLLIKKGTEGTNLYGPIPPARFSFYDIVPLQISTPENV